MILPISGAHGLMIYGVDEIPIYSFVFSSEQRRPEYRTSNSSLFPRRTSGILTEQIVIRGVENVPSFYSTAFTAGTAIDFFIGWNDFRDSDRKMILVAAMLEEIRFDFNYFSSPQPAFMWTASFIGCTNDKEIIPEPLTPHLDIPFCSYSLCDRVITTSDQTLHSGFVHHVKRASIINRIIRNPYMTSISDNHYKASTGVKDRIVEMEIEGDFDYWMDAVRGDDRYNYSYFFSPGGSFNAINMKPLSINNFVVNIQTGELLSALVRLGAAYG